MTLHSAEQRYINGLVSTIFSISSEVGFTHYLTKCFGTNENKIMAVVHLKSILFFLWDEIGNHADYPNGPAALNVYQVRKGGLLPPAQSALSRKKRERKRQRSEKREEKEKGVGEQNAASLCVFYRRGTY